MTTNQTVNAKVSEKPPEQKTEWKNGWTADNPIEFTYSYQPAAQAIWTKGTFPFLEYRDLCLAKASNGKISATQVRVIGTAARMQTGWHYYDLDFDFFYVIKGSVKIETEGGQRLILTTKSSGLQPSGLRHNFHDFTEDFEAVIIRAPAFVEPIFGSNGEAGRRGQYEIYSPDLYVRGNSGDGTGSIVGIRKYAAYRQFGVMEATGGRINIHETQVVDTPPKGGTGWHKHHSSNWYMVLSGHNEDGLEQLPETFIFSAGDVFCQGPGMAHVAGYNTADYAVLGLAIPASYTTVPLPTPPGFRFKFGAGGGQ